MAKEPEKPRDAQAASGGNAPRVRWDSSRLQSSYANVCSITSTREEVVFNFGLNQSWDRTDGELEIQLNNRIIVSPFAAKRMAQVLNQVLDQYEARHGKLSTDAG